MDTDLLKALKILAEEEHMTRASTRLHRTQPTVSAQLKRLEEEVGRPLFTRSRKGLTLTEAGAVFLTYAERALDQLERGRLALIEMEALLKGALTLGGGATAITYLLPSILARFHGDFPGVSLFVREQGSARTLAAVKVSALELGIITLPPHGALNRKEREQLEVVPWLQDRLRLIVPPGHPLEGRERFEWAALEGQPLVLFEAHAAARVLLDDRLRAEGVEPRIVMELRSIESIKRMVAQGIGAAFVSEHALEDAREGLRAEGGDVTRELAIVYRKDRPLSRAARVFLERVVGEE